MNTEEFDKAIAEQKNILPFNFLQAGVIHTITEQNLVYYENIAEPTGIIKVNDRKYYPPYSLQKHLEKGTFPRYLRVFTNGTGYDLV